MRKEITPQHSQPLVEDQRSDVHKDYSLEPKKSTAICDEEVDELCRVLEKSWQRLNANANSHVRRNAAERDLLKRAGACNELLNKSLGEDRTHLVAIFGGTCRYFHILNNIYVEAAALLTEDCAEDARWTTMGHLLQEIEAQLRRDGEWRDWHATAAPLEVSYNNGEFPEWLVDGIVCFFTPTVVPADAQYMIWSIDPPLPFGLSLDRSTGLIEGTPVEDVEVPQQAYTLTVGNVAGATSVRITFGIKTPPPLNLEYEAVDEETLVVVGSFTEFEPSYEGGRIKQFKMDKELPKGLVLDPVTGIISGVPKVQTEEEIFIVIGSNNAGQAEASFWLEVRPVPPTSIKYQGVHGNDFNIGSSLYVIPEVQMAGSDTYANLVGFTQSSRTTQMEGRLSRTTPPSLGRATSRAPEEQGRPPREGSRKSTVSSKSSRSQRMNMDQSLRIPGTNMGAQMTHTLSVSSRGSRYWGSPMVYEPSWGRGHCTDGTFQGTKWTKSRNPEWEHLMASGMRANITFVITPALPLGLSMSKSTGTISGRPTTKTPRRNYTVTASNQSGETTTSFSFGIVDAPPRSLQYPDVGDVLFLGQAVTFSPEVIGLVTRWSIEPALLSGLGFSEQMGTISGVLDVSCPATTWYIIAENEAGSVSTTVTFRVQAEEPHKLTYKPYVSICPLYLDMLLSPMCTASSGRCAKVDKFRVEPELPQGVILDSETGFISGKPEEVTPETIYRVTASNESGVCTAVIAFEIKEMPPSNLNYTHMDDYFIIGETVHQEPSALGGTMVWTVEPELPKGLEMDLSTGAISGTPEDIVPEQAFTVTASNAAGSASVVVEFEIVAPALTGLTYPECGTCFEVGRSINVEVVVSPSAAGAAFWIEPPLPAGLKINSLDGHISGFPVAAVHARTYVVTAANRAGRATCELRFDCIEHEAHPRKVDQRFAAALEEVTDIADLPPAPDRGQRTADWMLWMVHRAWLNDPTLTCLDFSNCQMLLPQDEPRMAPKLMNALCANTHITNLMLNHSNLRNPQAFGLAEALKWNTTLEVINVDDNWLDPDGILAIIAALKESSGWSKLSTLRFDNQQQFRIMGRRVEEEISDLLDVNERLTKVGFAPQDPHWKAQIVQKLLKNVDLARRQRKMKRQDPDPRLDINMVISKSLTKVVLDTVPEQAVWELFEDDDPRFRMLRNYVSERKRVPTREQMQNYTRGLRSLTTGQVAPALIQFRQRLFNAVVGMEITCVDHAGARFQGVLRTFCEKNYRINLDVNGTIPAGHWDFNAAAIPLIETSNLLADWIAVQTIPSESDAQLRRASTALAGKKQGNSRTVDLRPRAGSRSRGGSGETGDTAATRPGAAGRAPPSPRTSGKPPASSLPAKTAMGNMSAGLVVSASPRGKARSMPMR